MRDLQMFFGLVVVLFGVFFLLVANGMIVLMMIDIAGIALILSGLFFWIPAIIYRQRVPWLGFLLIPGSLAFATGGVLMYTGRAGMEAWSYAWTIFVIAVGLSFLAMYGLGMHERWVQWMGLLVTGIGALLFAILIALFGSEPVARSVGAIVLLLFGIAVTLRALMPRRQGVHRNG